MREDLLHFIWKTKKVFRQDLVTSNGEKIEVLQPGQHNLYEGPDFFNAQIRIAGQQWAGNIEMHLKASDWYVHGHETDTNYNNVVLHVVWEDDIEVFRKDGSSIPVLELRNVVAPNFVNAYQELLTNEKIKFINCEKDLKKVDSFLMESWLERLYIERLERKTTLVLELLRKSKNDWEAVLFSLLMQSFGTKRNKGTFLEIAESIDFAVIRKLSHDTFALESVLLGQARLLESVDEGNQQLKCYQNEYAFQKTKFGLVSRSVTKPVFFGLRPNNFPTIRLSQLANLYAKENSLFEKLIKVNHVDAIYDVFKQGPSKYWQTHYTFQKESKLSKKRITKNFVDLVIINTIIPIKFAYLSHTGNHTKDELLDIVKEIKPELNSIISSFDKLGVSSGNALETQAKLELYREYCTKNRCLQCEVGKSLLNKNT